MKKIVIAALCLLISGITFSQKVENSQISEMVQSFKKDTKGPYKDIRWFCKDGTTLPPQERCPEPGVQRARYKDEVISLSKTNHIFLGQILATTDFDAFWDVDNYHSLLKQYQLGNYLRRVDNGWILRKAQYYRGAMQAEDEERWGIDFFNSLLGDTALIRKNYFLLREAAKDIPHQGDDSKTLLVRALSKEISDSVPSFLNLRIKIHGQPEPSDTLALAHWLQINSGILTPNQQAKADELMQNMKVIYQAPNLKELNKYLTQIPSKSELAKALSQLIKDYHIYTKKQKIVILSEQLLSIRTQMVAMPNTVGRLALLDISLKLESILFREIQSADNETLKDLLSRTYYLSMAAAGCGYIELWEWDELGNILKPSLQSSISIESLNEKLEAARRMVEWSTGMWRGVYKDVIELYSGFEPLAYGFYDDRVRASLLLYLGDCVSDMGVFIAGRANLSNKVMGISGQGHIRGINPGYALGELVVINELSENANIAGDNIYVFNHAPADLKPVAGIATVSEGNMVSHVQLLARNLGIPNAVLSAQNLEALKVYDGKKVFYAVSNKGTVLMKPAEQMTEAEKNLFATRQRSEEKITVPTQRINLKQNKIVSLRSIDASYSGIICGPKAANLGQLKLMFPENVVDGFVIPFGIFNQHFGQTIPGREISYQDLLSDIFEQADEMRKVGKSEEEIDNFTIEQFEILRQEIKAMPLLPDFISDIEKSFLDNLGKSMGEIPVFLRSDTNMEDLKDFTGAGLNLTIFNVLDRDKILQGIKDVWASPYTARSYKWRQRYLLNPENVYPSILIIPGVDVDYSGVLITKGITSDNNDDLTIAFSRGAGGAVDGQAAESWLLKAGGDNQLVSPAREPFYQSLAATGGVEKERTTFEKAILSKANLVQIRGFATAIKQKMSKSDKSKSEEVYDIELGFKDNKIWLFQIRPFVENKNALRSEYLKSITPMLPANNMINVNSAL